VSDVIDRCITEEVQHPRGKGNTQVQRMWFRNKKSKSADSALCHYAFTCKIMYGISIAIRMNS